MTKLLLALGILATLAAPAAAGGRLDANPSILINPSQLEQVPAPEAGLTATRSAQTSGEARDDATRSDDPFNHGTLFGPNSR